MLIGLTLTVCAPASTPPPARSPSSPSPQAPPALPTPTQNLTSAPVTILSIQMLDAQTGWAQGLTGAEQAPRILRTADGGETWRAVSPGQRLRSSELNARAIFGAGNCNFLSPLYPSSRIWKLALVCESQSWLYTSANQGQTWIISPLPAGLAADIQFISPTSGWLLPTLVLIGFGWPGNAPRMFPANASRPPDDDRPARVLQATPPPSTTLYLPLIFRRQPLELHGQVLERGLPAAGLSVTLQKTYFRPLFIALVTTTLTGPDGGYNFTALETLTSCGVSPYCTASYSVVYSTPFTSPQRLQEWVTPAITNYVRGQFLNLGTFDIAAPVLITPAAGALVSATFTAEWQPRPEPTDNYQIVVWGNNLSFASAELGYASRYTLTLEPAFYTWPLQWALWIRTPAGTGLTYPAQFFIQD